MVAASGANPFAKEMIIRKRIGSIFNKREDDFPSLRSYNDYLEEVEDMIFNLIEGTNVSAIEASIAKYQQENAEQIIVAQARKAEELAAALQASKGPVNQSDTTNVGAGPNSEIGNGVTGKGHYAPTAHPGGAIGQPRPIGMAPQPLPIGSSLDHMQGCEAEDEETLRLKAERSARAGGWTSDISKKRAFEEAFSVMWI